MSEQPQAVPPQPSPKICPILSVGTLRPPQSALVMGPSGLPPARGGLDVVPCQGQACALWVDITNESGQAIDGRCALALLPNAVNSVAVMMQAIEQSHQTPPKAPNGIGTVNAIRKR